jgi:hypothetical protein
MLEGFQRDNRGMLGDVRTLLERYYRVVRGMIERC